MIIISFFFLNFRFTIARVVLFRLVIMQTTNVCAYAGGHLSDKPAEFLLRRHTDYRSAVLLFPAGLATLPRVWSLKGRAPSSISHSPANFTTRYPLQIVILVRINSFLTSMAIRGQFFLSHRRGLREFQTKSSDAICFLVVVSWNPNDERVFKKSYLLSCSVRATTLK